MISPLAAGGGFTRRASHHRGHGLARDPGGRERVVHQQGAPASRWRRFQRLPGWKIRRGHRHHPHPRTAARHGEGPHRHQVPRPSHRPDWGCACLSSIGPARSRRPSAPPPRRRADPQGAGHTRWQDGTVFVVASDAVQRRSVTARLGDDAGRLVLGGLRARGAGGAVASGVLRTAGPSSCPTGRERAGSFQPRHRVRAAGGDPWRHQHYHGGASASRCCTAIDLDIPRAIRGAHVAVGLRQDHPAQH